MHVACCVRCKGKPFVLAGVNPLNGFFGMSSGEEFLMGWKLDHFAAPDQWYLKGGLVAGVKHVASLCLSSRRRHVVASRSSEVIVKTAFQRMHRTLGEVFRVAGQMPFSQDRRGITKLPEHARHQARW